MILLDDAHSTASHPSSRLYRSPLQSWCVHDHTDHSATNMAIDACLQEINQALVRGQYVVAAFSYELGLAIHRLPNQGARGQAQGHPLMEAWSFGSYELLSKDQVDSWLAQEIVALDSDEQISGVANLRSSLNEAQFIRDVEAIQEWIRSGDTYQINHTYRIRGSAYGHPLALYDRLRRRQPGRFGAYIALGKHCILSQSPELFIQRRGDLLTAMPMKGTANAISETPEHLSLDPKNQAENVMIVDLLRNDLSRLAIPGSVSVPHLFSVARHGDVLQMTSTVQATAQPGVALKEVLAAVFPCGSVTGAPKKRSMEIIQALEPEDRAYYCGALGWFDPGGDFALSVPIRTVELSRNTKTQSASFVMGVGAGITIDSDAKQEWEECRIKSAFLSTLPSSVGIFESILIQEQQAQHLEMHLSRMGYSAHALGIPFSLADAKTRVQQAAMGCLDHKAMRLRLDLSPEGHLQYQTAPLIPLDSSVKLFWAKDLLTDQAQAIVHSGNVLLAHKVNHRPAYDAAWRAAETLGGFDAVFTNEQGFITEGGRSSIFIKLASSERWVTPPLAAGVLPGIMRAIVLNDSQWNAHEANISIEDLMNAKEIMLTNALRGVVTAHL